MKLIKLLLLLFVSTAVHAQIKFERISLEDALKKAGTNGKIIFAHFNSASCDQCNEVSDKAFTDNELGKIVSEKCIAIKIDVDNIERQSFIDKYNPTENIGTFFITADGDLIHRMVTTSTWPQSYINELDKAYNQFTEGRLPLKELDNFWNVFTTDFAAMKMNLRRRTELCLPVDSLLDVYVKRLPEDSLNSLNELQFIVKQTPLINSFASNTIRNNNVDLFNQSWYLMPLKERISINNRIIYKSREKAVKNKDIALAYQAASFAYGVNNGSRIAAQKAYDYHLMEYYKDVKDTANALPRIIRYVEEHLMKLSVDSIRYKDSVLTKKRFNDTKADTVKVSATQFRITKMFASSTMSQSYSSPLNSAAWFIYKNSNHPYYLAKALTYAERAVKIYESAEVIDTYSRLLYQTGKVTEAIAWQEKGIKILNDRKFIADRYIAVLQKMKAGEDVKNAK